MSQFSPCGFNGMAGESLEDQSLIAVLTPLVEHPDAKGRILRIERSLRMCWMCLENCGWLWLKDYVSNWTTNVESCSIFIQYNPSIFKHLELMARFMEFGILWSPENRNSVTWWHSRSFDPPQQLMMGPPLRTAKCSFSPQIHQAVFCWNNGRI